MGVEEAAMADEGDVMARIEEYRSRIDEVDRELVKLLNSRAEMSLAIRELKPKVNRPLYDPKREEEIFDHLSELNEGPLFDDNVREIFEVLLHVMKEL
jgi:chorismate mutase